MPEIADAYLCTMLPQHEHLKPVIRQLPKSPGVYSFYDKSGNILYVGKAKNLKNRVSSYFSKQKYESGKTLVMVRRIHRIEYIVVDTEYEALLLENSLIKKHQPRYNVMLRDDKTYPWICIKKERFPRVFATRNVVDDGSEYYGPYPSVTLMKTLLDIVSRLYRLRSCNYVLSESNIAKKKFRICLDYHIGNCLGPCEGRQTEEDYNNSIREIRHIIKGNLREVQDNLKQRMLLFAGKLEFEKAQEIKEKLELLEKYRAKSTVVNPRIHDVDVFGITGDGFASYVNYMKINNGAVVQSSTMEIRKRVEEKDSELLAMAIIELRQRFGSRSEEIYLSRPIDIDLPGIKVVVPKKGDKKKLIDLSLKNAGYYMLDRQKDLERTDPERHTNRILTQLQKDLHLKEPPVHIECFDNSNMQGDQPVAACVVFRNARPAKKEYRHFNIKTVQGPDDYASMEEVVYRRYSRMIREGETLPQLIVIDGGKGQLGAAWKSLERLGLKGKVTAVGIAKRLEEIYFPDDQLPLYIDKRSLSLKIIQQLRNEAHRFGITHHRKKRKKATLHTELAGIKGIGMKTATRLLRKFGSVKRIRETPVEKLAETVGRHKARIIVEYFGKNAANK